jgi:hypothetical protein
MGLVLIIFVRIFSNLPNNKNHLWAFATSLLWRIHSVDENAEQSSVSNDTDENIDQ